MTRPLCDHTEDDGTPCSSWAIDGYDQCVRHWQPGIGPKRLHAPAYTGPYAQSYKLDRPIDDEPSAPSPAQPYETAPQPATLHPGESRWLLGRGDAIEDPPHTAELTPEPETVQTPVENESLVASVPWVTERELREMPAEELAKYRADAELVSRVDRKLSKFWNACYPPAKEPDPPVNVKIEPNPPSRRGWRRLFRRAA